METINAEALFRAKKALNEFLEKHPDLKLFQQQIDKALNAAGSPENRIAIIKTMIGEKIKELSANLNNVCDLTKVLVEQIKVFKQ